MATGKLRESNRDNAGDFIGECSVPLSCVPCMKTNVSKTATVFCNDCNEFLCDACKNPHTVYKFGKHDIVNIQDRKSVPVGVDMKGMDICPEHGKELEFYCQDHTKFCCSKCILIHRKCDQVDEIANASGQERSKLQALQQSMIKLQSEADAIIEDCKQSETGLNESVAKISSDVDKMRERIVQLFEDAKKKLITDAKQFQSAEGKRFKIKSEASFKVKEEMYKVLPICCAVLEHGTPSQQYMYSKIIQEKNNTWQSIINENRNLKMSPTVTVSFPRELSTLLEMGNDFIKLNCNGNNPGFGSSQPYAPIQTDPMFQLWKSTDNAAAPGTKSGLNFGAIPACLGATPTFTFSAQSPAAGAFTIGAVGTSDVKIKKAVRKIRR